MIYARYFLKGTAWGVVILAILAGLYAVLPVILEPIRQLELLQPSLKNRPFSIDPEWSSDGQYIVANCAFGTGGSFELPTSSYEVCIAQSDLRNLTTLSPRITTSNASLSPTWAPNSQLIAFSDFNLYVAGVSDLMATLILENCSFPSWSPDSQYIACVRDFRINQLVIVNIATGEREIVYNADGLVDKPDLRLSYNLLRKSYWSTDSHYIYVAEKSWVLEDELHFFELNQIELDTGLSTRVIYLETQREFDYSVAPNGQQLLVNSYNNLEILNLQDSSRKYLLTGKNVDCVTDIVNVSWSKDSHFIAFYAEYRTKSYTRLFILDLTSFDLFELVQPDDWVFQGRDEIAWSPDGSRIATSFDETFVLLWVSDKKPANC